MSDQTGLEKAVSNLARLRDELRLQVHLGTAELKDTWDELEIKWKKLQKSLKAAGREGADAGRDVQVAVRLLVDEVGRGYERVRDALAERDR